MTDTHEGAERPYLVIGDPVGHSLSPQLFGWLDPGLEYRAERVSAEALAGFVEARAYSGLSITLPHKERIGGLLDDVRPEAARIGAVNCVSRDGDRLIGWNTDGVGLLRALVPHGPLEGARVQILGAGGAARAAAFALAFAGARVVIHNRTEDRAERLAADVRAALPANASGAAATGIDIDSSVIIQATSVGLDAPDSNPLPPSFELGPGHLVLDMVYRPLKTALLARAEAAGARTVDGLWMLVEQGLCAYEIWTGRPTSGVAPALHAHLVTSDAIVTGRVAIDAIDRELIALLRGRFASARAIGEVKAARGEPVVRPERERELRDKHRRWAEEAGVDPDLARRVFDVILDSSRRMQEKLKP